MNGANALYHMARADFLERVRRYSFLVMLLMVVWLGYAVNTGSLVMSVPPNFVGEINSPWVGGLMTVTVGTFLGLFGFYLVKGSISRDYETRVGQIIATTPLSRPLYMLGKWLSNFAVLAVMIIIIMAAGVVMVLLVGKAPLDLWALVSPLLFFAIPLMALVAALAVLFEAISWLRGSFGNVVYWFVFILALVPSIAYEIAYHPLIDFTGMRLVGEGIFHAAEAAYPGIEKGFSFQAVQSIADPQRFYYPGIALSASVILPRIWIILIAGGLTMLAAIFFDRFNSSKASSRVNKRAIKSTPETVVAEPTRVPQIRLMPLAGHRHFSFDMLYKAELKLLLKGHRWWWYATLVGLLIGQLLVPDDTIPKMLALTWFCLIQPLGGSGNREAVHNTREIVFSTPRPVGNQLPASWLATITLVALMGSGAFLRYLLGSDLPHLLAWFGGVLFIPALASGLGVLTHSRKPFEVVYITWMYIVLQPVASLDFVGEDPGSPWLIYTLLAVGLLTLAAFFRLRELRGGKNSS